MRVPLDILCPTCQAPAGQPCTTTSGDPRDPHKDRVALARIRDTGGPPEAWLRLAGEPGRAPDRT
jgi:hypothetical protein